MKTLIGLLLALVCAAPQTVNIAGKWNVAVVEHGNLQIVLEIKQDGNKLTANFIIPDHGDLEMTGDLAGQNDFEVDRECVCSDGVGRQTGRGWNYVRSR